MACKGGSDTAVNFPFQRFMDRSGLLLEQSNMACVRPGDLQRQSVFISSTTICQSDKGPSTLFPIPRPVQQSLEASGSIGDLNRFIPRPY